MTLLEAVFCGIIQGLAEFLPISSSGHLAIAHSFFETSGAEGNLMFDLLLHLATLIVVLTFYYRDIFPLVPAFFTMTGKIFRGKIHFCEWTVHERYVLMLMLATFPLAAGLFVKDQVELIALYPKLVGGILVLNGFVLILADRMAKHMKDRELTPISAFGIGCFQLLAAMLPGLSRSGSTISGGLFFGLSREEAVRFSFILSVPAIFGANIFSIPDAVKTPIPEGELLCMAVGMAVAMIFGFFAMKFLLYMSRRARFGAFAYYCMAVGLLSVLFA